MHLAWPSSLFSSYSKKGTVLEHVDKFLVELPMNVSPCHHGMARPQVADGGTASYMEGSCE
jgi:hypothetical protein